jgi:small subunit ribosomal protein S9
VDIAMVMVKKDKITGDALGTGRRKTSVARVRLRTGSGKITINGRSLEDYFPNERDRRWLLEPLEAAHLTQSVDIIVRASGGGLSGQAGACRMGIARALVSFNPDLFSIMRNQGYLTRDSRMKERKKYGLHGARRGTQFSKR